MFGRAIWDKLPECIFGNFAIARVKRGQFQSFQKSPGWFIPKIAKTKHVISGLSHQTNFPLKLISLTAGNYKSVSRQLQNSGQLQNNTANGEMSITINPVINLIKYILINFNNLVLSIKLLHPSCFTQEFWSKCMSIERKPIWTVRIINECHEYCSSLRWSINSLNDHWIWN